MLEKGTISIKDIKTNFIGHIDNPSVQKALRNFSRSIFPLEYPVVHKASMELIANSHYYLAHKDAGENEIEIVYADFPIEDLPHAVALHWEPPTTYMDKYKFIPYFMEYYKVGGQGAKYRDEFNGHSLREFVAAILGTNRTSLDQIEDTGDYNITLLELVDKGEVSLKEAFSLIPKKTKKGRDAASGNNAKPHVQKVNKQIPVLEVSELSSEELNDIAAFLPDKYANELVSGVIPNGMSINKAYTYNEIFQGFTVVFLNNAIAATLHITYLDNLAQEVAA